MFLLTITSCTDKYSISGSALQTLYSAKVAYLRSPDGDKATVDSCEIVHGNFKMNGPLDSVQCVNLILGDVITPVVLEQGNIKVSMANAMIKVEGTPLNDRLFSFLVSRDSLTMMLMEIPNKDAHMRLEGYSEYDIATQLGDEEANLRSQMENLETAFVVDNFDNVLGITWFLNMCYEESNRYGYPTTSPKIEELYSRAPEDFRNNPKVVEFMNMVNGQGEEK